MVAKDQIDKINKGLTLILENIHYQTRNINHSMNVIEFLTMIKCITDHIFDNLFVKNALISINLN